MHNIYIIDVETASLHGGVVELAYLKVDCELNVLDEFCARVNPERPIDPGAQAVHGIGDADVADCPTLAEVTANFSEPVVWCGHNASFDVRMLTPHITPKQQLCTLALSREFIKGTTNHKLATLKDELKLPEQKSHSALGDVHTTRDLLLLHILPLSGVNLQTLLDRADQPKLLAKMPFGVHKGKIILRVPKDYRNWMLAQSDIPKDLRFTLEKFRNL
jgi:DNA polymerase III epsilon subunit-like protein